MKLIVGLGNPGPEYEKTRHNIGYMVLDKLAETTASGFKVEKKFEGEIAQISSPGKAILLKPTTFMNLSGRAVKKVADYFGIANNNIWIVADEYDLPLGTIRVKESTGESSHNGIKSVIAELGNFNFVRFRLGIFVEDNMAAVDNFVLNKFAKNEISKVDQVIEKTVEIIEEELKSQKDEKVPHRTIDLSE